MEWRHDAPADGDFVVHREHHEGDGVTSFSLEGVPDAMVTVHFGVERGRVTFRELDFEGEDITAEMLRAVSLPDMRAAILDDLQDRMPIKKAESRNGVSLADLRQEWPNGERLNLFLRVVAKLYNDASARQRPPTMAVASALSVSRATASRMVAKAREAGINLVDPAPYPGKRKRDHEQKDDN